MNLKKILVSLVAFFALAVLFAGSVSAFATVSNVEVNGESALGVSNIAVFAGETIPVEITFTGTANTSEVEVEAWISGYREGGTVSGPFDVISGARYTKLLAIKVPFDIDPAEDRTLQIRLEGNNGAVIVPSIDLIAERDSFVVEVLDISMEPTVRAGDNIVADVVLKNRGRQFAEDTFVRVTIPALSVEKRVYFGDLSPEDEPYNDDPFLSNVGNDRLDKEDAALVRWIS